MKAAAEILNRSLVYAHDRLIAIHHSIRYMDIYFLTSDQGLIHPLSNILISVIKEHLRLERYVKDAFVHRLYFETWNANDGVYLLLTIIECDVMSFTIVNCISRETGHWGTESLNVGSIFSAPIYFIKEIVTISVHSHNLSKRIFTVSSTE